MPDREEAKTVTLREEQLLKRLNELAKTGFFGTSATDVAETLIRAKLRDLRREGWFQKEPNGRS